jgi:hypothetical protein
MLGLGRRFWFGARGFGHVGKSSLGSGYSPFCSRLDATLERLRSTVQPCESMPRIPSCVDAAGIDLVAADKPAEVALFQFSHS